MVAGEAKNREAIVKTLSFFTSIYKEGYVPPDALTWTDADNNVNFNNKHRGDDAQPVHLHSGRPLLHQQGQLLQQDRDRSCSPPPRGREGVPLPGIA